MILKIRYIHILLFLCNCDRHLHDRKFDRKVKFYNYNTQKNSAYICIYRYFYVIVKNKIEMITKEQSQLFDLYKAFD